MTTPAGPSSTGAGRRSAAVAALVLLAVAPIAGALFVLGNLLAVLTTILGLSIATAFGWIALTHRGAQRAVAGVIAVVALVAVVGGVVTALAIRGAPIGLAILAGPGGVGGVLARHAIGAPARGAAGGVVWRPRR